MEKNLEMLLQIVNQMNEINNACCDELKELKASNDRLANENVSLNEKLNELQSTTNKRLDEFNEVYKIYRKLKSEYEERNKSLDDKLKAKDDAFRKMESDKNNEIKKLNDKINDDKAVLNQKVAELNQKRNEISRLTTEKNNSDSQHKKDYANLNSKYDKVSKENDELLTKNAELSDKNKELAADNEERIRWCTAISKERMEDKAKIQKLESEKSVFGKDKNNAPAESESDMRKRIEQELQEKYLSKYAESRITIEAYRIKYPNGQPTTYEIEEARIRIKERNKSSDKPTTETHEHKTSTVNEGHSESVLHKSDELNSQTYDALKSVGNNKNNGSL